VGEFIRELLAHDTMTAQQQRPTLIRGIDIESYEEEGAEIEVSRSISRH
jgi:hypothetical protein